MPDFEERKVGPVDANSSAQSSQMRGEELDFTIEQGDRVTKDRSDITYSSQGDTFDDLAGTRVKTQLQLAARRFFRHRLAVVSLSVFIGLLILSVAGGDFWQYNYSQITAQFSTGPSWGHPFGTDQIGHDLFAQVLRGTLTSIETSLLVAVIATTIGTVFGALAGYYGKLVDASLMRFTDLVLTVPVLAILLVLSNLLSKTAGSSVGLALILAGVLWTYLARLVRGTFLSLRRQDYVEAARALGARDARIILRHMLPNALGPIIVNATLTVANAILIEAALSFLGLGIQAPQVSLGLLIQQGEGAAITQPWLFVFPALFLVAIVLCVNFVGDGLRDSLDPRQGRVRE